MGDGPGDCARTAEYNARKYVKGNYPSLREFNPYHIPNRGEGYIIYETYLDHNLEIIVNHKVVKCLEFGFDKEPIILDSKENEEEASGVSIASGSRVEEF